MMITTLVFALGLQAAAPPPTPKFDAGRAWEHLRQLVAIGPRPSGSTAIEQTRKYIKDQLAANKDPAFQAALLASFLPTLMLSGFIFPISSMPRFLQLVTYAVPARYFLIALRGVVLKGAGIEAFGTELAALTAFALVVLALASVRLRRQWA